MATKSPRTVRPAASDDAAAAENAVFLRGVFAAEAAQRVLPSGDELCSFRVTVARPAGGRARVDSIDCSTTKATVRRAVLRCAPGDLVEVTGSLRRRFWRSPAGTPTSRYEVEVSALKNQRRSR
jgi:single-strand DNA-binding protein